MNKIIAVNLNSVFQRCENRNKKFKANVLKDHLASIMREDRYWPTTGASFGDMCRVINNLPEHSILLDPSKAHVAFLLIGDREAVIADKWIADDTAGRFEAMLWGREEAPDFVYPGWTCIKASGSLRVELLGKCHGQV